VPEAFMLSQASMACFHSQDAAAHRYRNALGQPRASFNREIASSLLSKRYAMANNKATLPSFAEIDGRKDACIRALVIYSPRQGDLAARERLDRAARRIRRE
jgi:hypothetical protein